MKKIIYTLTIITLVFFTSCSGSDAYRGDWRATDSLGAHFEITFEAEKFSVKNEKGETTNFNYTQNSVNINNFSSSYGIALGDGIFYSLEFPGYDKSIGYLYDDNESLLYTIRRPDSK